MKPDWRADRKGGLTPEWADAPEWANWAAMDSTGLMAWYEFKPVLNKKCDYWQERPGPNPGKSDTVGVKYWKPSLTKRPGK